MDGTSKRLSPERLEEMRRDHALVVTAGYVGRAVCATCRTTDGDHMHPYPCDVALLLRELDLVGNIRKWVEAAIEPHIDEFIESHAKFVPAPEPWIIKISPPSTSEQG